MTIDEMLKTIRKELRLSQEDLARALNISFTTINRWENSKSVPSKLARMRLIEYCKEKGIVKEIIDDLERKQFMILSESYAEEKE